jgi:hypothetical protein
VVHIEGSSRGGRKSASVRCLRSKDERRLYEICQKFSETAHNVDIVPGWDADILFPREKVAVLWNGPWHYREMNISNHSLKQVHNRDLIKKRKFKSIGWKLLIFEDRHFTPDTAAEVIRRVISQFG